MRRYRATKIVATLGPASSSQDVIEKLFLGGVDVFRLNFSHGTHQDHQKNYKTIRTLEEKYRRPISIMQDLQGPKLRIGQFENSSVTLREGQRFTLDLKEDLPGNNERVSLPHPEIFEAIREGTILLINDGKIRLRVSEIYKDSCETFVLVGGEISNNKGLNVPSVALPISSLTPKDREDLEFGLELGVDFVALSFVQKPDDIIEARDIIGVRAGIIAKIEKPLAVQHIKEIVRLSDAIMIARGDLGVEMMPEDVPSVQKQIVRDCRSMGRPVIVATQMLETMVEHPTPTRAEASDVACAVYEGVDAVMLSAETAAGKNPIEAVNIMNRIIERVEGDSYYRMTLDTHHPIPEATASDAITAAARKISDTLSLKAIVTLTTSGSTTLRAARERPNAPIVGITPDRLTAHLLVLTWGTHAIQLPEELADKPLPGIMHTVYQGILAENFAAVGDEILVTVGAQFKGTDKHQVFKAGSTRGLFILKVRDPREDHLPPSSVS
ncbi:MAG TPA: pyruvate kinase [Holosporales bacterium]|nr:pyruvate kinase [Holosporales bacterium]